MDLIADVATHIHLVQALLPRAATTLELMQALKGGPSLYTPHTCIEEGVRQAYEEALLHGELLVICGTFYIMADAKRVFSIRERVYTSWTGKGTISLLASAPLQPLRKLLSSFRESNR